MPKSRQPDQMRPADPSSIQDPARSYERARPEDESGIGRLTNNDSTPTKRPDKMDQTVRNRQVPEHQLNAEDAPEKSERLNPDH